MILTKLDGDARGGAALSIKEVTQVPIKFVGVGEKLDGIEEFHPERMAQRIIGQGDLMGLVEKVAAVQSEISQEELEKQQAETGKGQLDPSGFPQPIRADPQNGHEGHDQPHARHGRHDPRGRGPRSRPQARAGNDRFDDEGRERTIPTSSIKAAAGGSPPGQGANRTRSNSFLANSSKFAR